MGLQGLGFWVLRFWSCGFTCRKLVLVMAGIIPGFHKQGHPCVRGKRKNPKTLNPKPPRKAREEHEKFLQEAEEARKKASPPRFRV